MQQQGASGSESIWRVSCGIQWKLPLGADGKVGYNAQKTGKGGKKQTIKMMKPSTTEKQTDGKSEKFLSDFLLEPQPTH